MSAREGGCESSSCDYWLVSKAAADLTRQACTLGARHIKDGIVRIQFNREVAYYATAIVKDVAEGRKSPEDGLAAIKEEQSSLLSQSWEIAKKGVGIIAGTFQLAGGAGICGGSGGILCPVVGAPLMIHGANNVYENGRNLITGRSDTKGPVRLAYQAIAERLGGKESEGNIVYGAVDLALSGYGLFRPVLKPGAWRLFRYVRTDYVKAYTQTGKTTLLVEMLGNGLTLDSMVPEPQNNEQ